MNKFHKYKNLLLKKLGIILLIILCILSFLWFIQSVKYLDNAEDLNINNGYISHFRTPVTINSIRIWMTFDYLNFIFKLPPDYLKTSLNIDDKKYPNIRISEYVKRKNISPSVFIFEIKQAITNYQHSN
ncbi:MAG: hypothetical protein KGI58_01640 [Patescibacteria group bacterium]|nr:hypothetical protein [Patescibacteria group bacterium]